MNPKGASDCNRPERINGAARHPESAYLEAFYKQPIWDPLRRGPRSIRSPPVSAHFHCALRSWLLTSVLTPICPCKPFSCKACPGKDVQDVIVVIVIINPPPGAAGWSAFENAGSGRAEDARQQLSQFAVRGESRLRGRSAAARALGGAAGALGSASDRVGARIGSPPVRPHFS